MCELYPVRARKILESTASGDELRFLHALRAGQLDERLNHEIFLVLNEPGVLKLPRQIQQDQPGIVCIRDLDETQKRVVIGDKEIKRQCAAEFISPSTLPDHEFEVALREPQAHLTMVPRILIYDMN